MRYQLSFTAGQSMTVSGNMNMQELIALVEQRGQLTQIERMQDIRQPRAFAVPAIICDEEFN